MQVPGFRSALALLVALAAAPSTAQAAITPKRTDAEALELAQAIAREPSVVTSSTFSTIAPPGIDQDPAALSDVPLATFPRNGSTYAILSTGDAKLADHPNDAADSGVNLGEPPGPTRGPSAYDPLTWNIGLDVPAGRNCLIVRFRLLSEEFPEYLNMGFRDGFLAELDHSTWTTSADSAAPPSAPDNFAFDQQHDPITIKTAGLTAATADNAAGTTYDGATRRLAAATPVTPGPHTLFLSVFDEGDGVYDSAVLVDDLQLRAADPGRCATGSFADDAAPALANGSPAGSPEPLVADGQITNDETPAFGGTAGTSLNDDGQVTGTIYAAASLRAAALSGEAVQTKKVAVSGDGSWTYIADALPEGSYAFQATQASGNGLSAAADPVRFTIDRTPPAPAVAVVGHADKTRDTTPAISGAVGTASGDAPAITVRVYAGRAATGNPLQTFTGSASGGQWSVTVPAALRDGTYTAVVEQADVAGNTGTASRTFAVTTGNPIRKVALPARLTRGRAANGLKGGLRFDFPGRVVFTLSARVRSTTLRIGTSIVALAEPGLARFAIRPTRTTAALLRRSRGYLALKIRFTDEFGRRYSRTQVARFR
jgi:hypothetical protein